MCGCDSYDGPSVYHSAIRVSRRGRKCGECGAPIAKGQRYSHSAGCWDGEWNSFEECLRCDALRQAWHDTEGCWPSHGNLRDDVLECLRDGRRWPPDGDYDERADIGPPDPVCLKFGINYRRRLGHMGPRRAA
jgi:hypothetical protein